MWHSAAPTAFEGGVLVAVVFWLWMPTQEQPAPAPGTWQAVLGVSREQHWEAARQARLHRDCRIYSRVHSEEPSGGKGNTYASTRHPSNDATDPAIGAEAASWTNHPETGPQPIASLRRRQELLYH